MAATRVICLVCGKEGHRGDFKVIALTAEERLQVPNPLDEYPYCKPCWGVLSDPAAAPALMSGIARHHLQQAGVVNADKLASDFRKALAEKALEGRN